MSKKSISRDKVKIWILSAGTAPSTVTDGDAIIGEIRNWDLSGGADDVETEPVFGGFIDKRKPREQFELSFDVVPQIGTTAEDWESYIYTEDGSNSGVYTSAGSTADHCIYIQAEDGSNYKSWGFNNCNSVTLDMSHSADDNMEASLSLKFSPADADGTPNFQYSKVAAASLITWASLDTE